MKMREIPGWPPSSPVSTYVGAEKHPRGGVGTLVKFIRRSDSAGEYFVLFMSDGTRQSESSFRPPASLLNGIESVLEGSTGLDLNQVGEKDIPGTQASN